MGKLYIIPTPIGNLRDITLRALDVLKQVEFIACEDTRRTKNLLELYGIKNKKLIPYYAPREKALIKRVLKILYQNDLALVVDAGMPLISDPGYQLVRACWEKKIALEVLPGPSAFLTALIASGLPTDRFIFLGFLPRKGLENYLKKFLIPGLTLVFYESPQRLYRTLVIINKIMGEGEVVIAREISKIYEEYLRGKINDILKLIENRKIKGECTIVLRQK